jgi:transcriptional regulator with XRE-family HTH domain
MSRLKKKRSEKASPELIQLANRIKTLRLKTGKSMEAFAGDADISRALYPKYEKGANITYTTLLKIIHCLDMTVAEFFSEGFD